VCIAVVTGQKVKGYQILWLYELKIFYRPTVVLILCPVFDNEEENCRISTNKEINTMIKISSVRETIRFLIFHRAFLFQ